MEVVGESRYQDALVAICGRYTRQGHEDEYRARLVREPSNAFDQNAVAVTIEGRKVGYLGRDQAERLSAQMDEAGLNVVNCGARVRGGWRTNQYDEGNYGVRLAIPTWGWIDLGIGAAPPIKERAPTRASSIPKPAPTGPLKGERIVIQGAPSDGPLANELAAAGARIVSRPGKTTTLLVVAENRPFPPGYTLSSRYKLALEFGIPVLSIDDIRARLAPGNA